VFAAGTFANNSYVHCQATPFTTSIASLLGSVFFDTGDDSWSANSSGGLSIALSSFNTTPSAIDSYMTVKCEGQAP
jgi:hypothetical protein